MWESPPMTTICCSLIPCRSAMGHQQHNWQHRPLQRLRRVHQGWRHDRDLRLMTAPVVVVLGGQNAGMGSWSWNSWRAVYAWEELVIELTDLPPECGGGLWQRDQHGDVIYSARPSTGEAACRFRVPWWRRWLHRGRCPLRVREIVGQDDAAAGGEGLTTCFAGQRLTALYARAADNTVGLLNVPAKGRPSGTDAAVRRCSVSRRSALSPFCRTAAAPGDGWAKSWPLKHALARRGASAPSP